ncbi:MAG: pat [Verrucomicrobiales bacterium]|nr:pat [Verrucomicrobiales bacterium]
MSSAPLRPATLDDLPAINAIYNFYVLTSTATYQTQPESDEARLTWFSERDLALHPVMVAEVDGRVAAWGSLSRFGKREAFAGTVENSIYVHPDFQRRGLGRALLADQLERAAAAGHHTIIAAISGEQNASLNLHLAHGFTHAGRLVEAGWKFNQWLDLVYLQKII